MPNTAATEKSSKADAANVPLSRGLSTKLLLLTILFVMLAEVLIFVPSIANFRLRWLEERLATAAAVGIVLVESDPQSLSRIVQDNVLLALGAKAVALRSEGVSQLLVVSEMPPEVDAHVDLANAGPWMAMRDAIDTMLFGGRRVLRVFGPVGESTSEFELIIADKNLRQAMLVYARNVAILSLIISLITATLVFYAINRIMIRPIRDMTHSMLSFAEAPDDPSRIVRPERRGDEIGVAERELAAMQTNLQRTLAERKHLADLGLAVSKINHDMRNMLATAQLMSDRLRTVNDPTVQNFVPKLVRTLDRAVSYSEGVLAYGRTQEAPPSRRRVRLSQLVDDVFALIGMDAVGGIELRNDVGPEFEVDADSDQLFRVLSNLARNAAEAMASDRGEAVVRRLTIGAERTGSVSRILVEDTGPGLPQKARENLFAAFRGSARSGGTGLGLAIAFELVRAHGGSIELVESRGGRTVFAITIPDQPVDLDSARGTLRRPA
ncbi:HAMP domain-containing sensor histidine kinase [Aquamicrobium sp. LC103]|uniref:sensor histidine kinase n=1 Tax=Aquamicrobium sp. LC103 TaxID=1120658 RepID=UPI00063EAF1A|nr:HAMP domain-containing sensor histidine kinase [Aquamicrobium sp. LC103]